jgi:two-component system, cell cycle sensor histidine kinase and response regulator CckA
MGARTPSTHDTPRCGTARTGNSVLVMDDDPLILMLAGGMLERLGYQVTTCVNGEEAVALYRGALEAGAPYLAVILDLEIAGGMGGKEAGRGILAIDPRARLIVSSGNRNAPAVAAFRQFGFCSVMCKPYGMDDLAKVLTDLPTSTKVA